MKKYRAINPEGGYEENLDRNLLPQDWNIIEVEIEDNSQQLAELKKVKIKEIDDFYKSEISKLVSPYIEKNFFDGTPVPEIIYNQREALITECNQKIKEIDPEESMSKPSQQLIK